MKTHQYLNTALFYSVLTWCNLSFAGGPLVIEGPNDNTPVKYQNPYIVLHVENGKLGERTNAEADLLLQDALKLWNNVSTTTVNLIFNDTLIVKDINETNFENYLPSLDESVFNADDNLNPVIYDDNGEIIDTFFGLGQSDNTIGFAASIFFSGESYFEEGYAVINGKNLNLSDTEFRLLIAHEIGHLIGLDHSQVDINNKEGSSVFGFCATSSNLGRYPVMYPFACRNEGSLHPDDISSISALYPNTSVNKNFGILSGVVTDKSGRAVLGANIWAENNDGRTFSIVSDYLKQGTGFYELLLPPGNYTLHANTINTAFTGGSSIGPYALTPDSVSFTCLEPFTDTRYEGDTPGSVEVITISANQATTTNFNLADIDVSGCPAPPKQSSAKSSSGSSSKGSFETSPEILWLLSLLLLFHRIRNKYKETNTSESYRAGTPL